MPIPPTTSSDILLRTMLDLQVEDFSKRIEVEELLPRLPFLDDQDCNVRVPASVQRDLEFLEHHKLVIFWPENPHARLTPLGVFTALLFAKPDVGSKEST
jgi:hypothetical protein